MYFDDRTSGGRSNSSTPSSGMTCCKSLRRRRLAHQDLMEALIRAIAHLVNRRSCKEFPYSLLSDPAESLSFSFDFEFDPMSDPFSFLRLPFGSDDGPSLPETATTGTGSSRLANVSVVYSSISAGDIQGILRMRSNTPMIWSNPPLFQDQYLLTHVLHT